MCDPISMTIGAAKVIGSFVAANAIPIASTAIAGATYERGRKATSQARDQAKSAQQQAQSQYDDQKTSSDQRYTEQQDLMEAERIRAQEREDAATAERQRLRNEELQRQSKIAEGRSAVSDVFGQTFTPGFYDQQQQAFLDFQNPQLEDQYKDAGSELLFALTRTGLGQSSAMNKRQAKLADTYSQAGQDIVDEGARRRAQTEAAVNQQKQVLMGQAEAAHDPSYMRGLAQSQSASLAAPQSLSNIGDVFATALSGITSAYDQERRKTAIADRMRRASEYGISGAGSSNVVS
jgi:hypothetical protein